MAASSIFANVRITDTQKAEEFAEALDASAKDPARMPKVPVISLVTNIEEIQKFMIVGTEKDNA